jgi:hypothetical protein
MARTARIQTALEIEVRQANAALVAIAEGKIRTGFGDGYKQTGIDFSLNACDVAAQITGCDPTFCRMLNHEFRTKAAELMFDRALASVA